MRADAIARALGGRRVGASWMALCPAHDDRRPSLSIGLGVDGKVLVRCHAGCGQARLIDALRARGLWDSTSDDAAVTSYSQLAPAGASSRPREACQYVDAIRRITEQLVPARGTSVQTYLRSRGIEMVLPTCLRFHPRLKHPSGTYWPAMVALVRPAAAPGVPALHRTFLGRDGSSKAPVEPQRMMLGSCRGAAVRLAPAAPHLLVGEGIETCLSAMQATGRPAWAALSTSGLRTLELPATVREVTILADGDDPGERAARDAARRWHSEGRRVRIARPGHGLDFNDLLCARTAPGQEGAR